MAYYRAINVVGLLSLCLSLVSADEASTSECARSPDSAMKTLMKRVLCNYDREVAPINKTTEAVEVKYILIPEFFEFDEYSNILTIHGDVIMEWNDPRLAWNKTDYGGIDEIHLLSTKFWVPDFILYSYSTVGDHNSVSSDSNCDIEFNGDVSCYYTLHFYAHCNPDVTRWPFDSHTCSVMIIPRTNDVKLIMSTVGMATIDFDSDKYWKLVDYRPIRQNSSENGFTDRPKIIFSFDFERHSSFLVATFFVPAIVMLVATLSTFCLDPEGAARMFLIGANTICHCLFLMYLAWYLPANGDKTPIVVTFFRDSFVLVGVSLVITVCAGKMRAAARAPPAWVTSIADGVQDSPAQHLLFNGLYTKSDAVDEDEEDTVAAVMASSTSNKWRRIATLLDRISLLVFSTIITALSCAFLP